MTSWIFIIFSRSRYLSLFQPAAFWLNKFLPHTPHDTPHPAPHPATPHPTPRSRATGAQHTGSSVGRCHSSKRRGPSADGHRQTVPTASLSTHPAPSSQAQDTAQHCSSRGRCAKRRVGFSSWALLSAVVLREGKYQIRNVLQVGFFSYHNFKHFPNTLHVIPCAVFKSKLSFKWNRKAKGERGRWKYFLFLSDEAMVDWTMNPSQKYFRP